MCREVSAPTHIRPDLAFFSLTHRSADGRALAYRQVGLLSRLEVHDAADRPAHRPARRQRNQPNDPCRARLSHRRRVAAVADTWQDTDRAHLGARRPGIPDLPARAITSLHLDLAP